MSVLDDDNCTNRKKYCQRRQETLGATTDASGESTQLPTNEVSLTLSCSLSGLHKVLSSSTKHPPSFFLRNTGDSLKSHPHRRGRVLDVKVTVNTTVQETRIHPKKKITNLTRKNTTAENSNSTSRGQRRPMYDSEERPHFYKGSEEAALGSASYLSANTGAAPTPRPPAASPVAAVAAATPADTRPTNCALEEERASWFG